MRTLLPVVLAALPAFIATAQPCTEADVRGVYLFQASGWQNTPDPAFAGQMVPMRGLGLVSYDGKGAFTGQVTLTVAGTPAPFEFNGGKYVVNADCTATAEYRVRNTATGAELGPQLHRVLILEDGALLRTLMTDSGAGGTIITGELRRLARGPRACHPSLLRGTYALHYDGWINMRMFNPTQNYFAPATGTGQIRIDPEGAPTGGGLHNWGGIASETHLITATWKVNQDCTGTYEASALNKTFGMTSNLKYPIIVTEDGAKMTALGTGMDALWHFARVSIP